VLFRKRVGESGVEKILTLSVKVHKGGRKSEDGPNGHHSSGEKHHLSHRSKTSLKILFWTRRIAKSSEVKLKQTYDKEEKRLRRQSTVPNRQKGIEQKRRAALQEHYAPYLSFF